MQSMFRRCRQHHGVFCICQVNPHVVPFSLPFVLAKRIGQFSSAAWQVKWTRSFHISICDMSDSHAPCNRTTQALEVARRNVANIVCYIKVYARILTRAEGQLRRWSANKKICEERMYLQKDVRTKFNTAGRRSIMKQVALEQARA